MAIPQPRKQISLVYAGCPAVPFFALRANGTTAMALPAYAFGIRVLLGRGGAEKEHLPIAFRVAALRQEG